MADTTARDVTLGAFLPPVEIPEWKPPPWPPGCPEPGIYTDVPYREYAAWAAINSSVLKEGWEETAKRMKCALDGKLKGDSRDRKFGRATHGRLLEPDSYAQRFPVALPCAEPLKSGPRKDKPCGSQATFFDGDRWLWYCGTHAKAHPEAMTPDDYVTQEGAARIERMVVSVYSEEVVRLLRSHGGCEVSLVWERDGLACKARLDKFIHNAPSSPDTIVDVKKATSGKLGNEAVNKSIRDWVWDLQAYWYADGARRLTGNKTRFAWLMIEDGEPFDVRLPWLTPARRELGCLKATKAFEMYVHGLQTGEWPGHCQDRDELNPADWEMKRYGIHGD